MNIQLPLVVKLYWLDVLFVYSSNLKSFCRLKSGNKYQYSLYFFIEKWLANSLESALSNEIISIIVRPVTLTRKKLFKYAYFRDAAARRCKTDSRAAKTANTISLSTHGAFKTFIK